MYYLSTTKQLTELCQCWFVSQTLLWLQISTGLNQNVWDSLLPICLDAAAFTALLLWPSFLSPLRTRHMQWHRLWKQIFTFDLPNTTSLHCLRLYFFMIWFLLLQLAHVRNMVRDCLKSRHGLRAGLLRFCKTRVNSKRNFKGSFVLPCCVITAYMNVCNELCAVASVCLHASIICSTSWLTCACPVRNHLSVLLRTDKVIQSLFLSGMHQWIVHQFTTYFPMRFLFFFLPFSFFTQSWVWKEKLWYKQRGHRGANPSGHSEKEQLQKGLQYHGELYKGEKCHD